jgi:peptidoglycan hydrolase-like protein with peptidoglycan-binding domain
MLSKRLVWTWLNTGLLLANIAVIVFITVYNISVEQKLASLSQSVLGASIPIFDKNTVVTDTAFRSTRAFPSSESVQSYLVSKQAPIAKLVDQGKNAGQIIFEAARGITSSKWGKTPQLNPGLILAYLEKEQSLIGLSGYDIVADPEKRVRSAMGYGCPDGSSCNPEYAGFYNQVNWGAYQLEYNYALALRTDHTDPYKINGTISTLDNYSVFLSNAATASQYRYTPHVYWGNYNLWKIMTSNAWGDSDQTFTYSELDAASKPGQTGTTVPPSTTITFEEVKNLIVTPPALGTQNADISKLQLFLKQMGTFTYPTITGYYGTITQTALEAYKASPNYIVTPPPPVVVIPPAPADPCVTLKNQPWTIGQTGADVKQLQDCMTPGGYFSFAGGSTGYFGSITQAALVAYKQVGGVVTPAPITQDGCASLKSIASGWSIGRTGGDVRELQQCLQNQGTYTWPAGVTGYFGNYTKGLIINSAPSVGACESQKNAARGWAIGRTGGDVRELQQCLKDAGIYTWQFGVTGYFGNYTKGLL